MRSTGHRLGNTETICTAGVLKGIWTVKWFPVDRRGPPVSANKAEMGVRGSLGKIVMWTPETKVQVPLMYTAML